MCSQHLVYNPFAAWGSPEPSEHLLAWVCLGPATQSPFWLLPTYFYTSSKTSFNMILWVQLILTKTVSGRTTQASEPKGGSSSVTGLSSLGRGSHSHHQWQCSFSISLLPSWFWFFFFLSEISLAFSWLNGSHLQSSSLTFITNFYQKVLFWCLPLFTTLDS